MKTMKLVCDGCGEEIDPNLPGSIEVSVIIRTEKTPRTFDFCVGGGCRKRLLELLYADKSKPQKCQCGGAGCPDRQGPEVG